MFETVFGMIQNINKYTDTEDMLFKMINDNIVSIIYAVSTILLFLIAYKKIKTQLKTLKRAFKIAVLNQQPSRSEHWILFDDRYQDEPIAILSWFVTLHAIVDAYYFGAALFRAEYTNVSKMLGQFTIESAILITIAILAIVVRMRIRDMGDSSSYLKTPVKTISLYAVLYYIAYVLSMSILYFFTTSKARFFAFLWLFFFTVNDDLICSLASRTNGYFGTKK